MFIFQGVLLRIRNIQQCSASFMSRPDQIRKSTSKRPWSLVFYLVSPPRREEANTSLQVSKCSHSDLALKLHEWRMHVNRQHTKTNTCGGLFSGVKKRCLRIHSNHKRGWHQPSQLSPDRWDFVGCLKRYDASGELEDGSQTGFSTERNSMTLKLSLSSS